MPSSAARLPLSRRCMWTTSEQDSTLSHLWKLMYSTVRQKVMVMVQLMSLLVEIETQVARM